MQISKQCSENEEQQQQMLQLTKLKLWRDDGHFGNICLGIISFSLWGLQTQRNIIVIPSTLEDVK